MQHTENAWIFKVDGRFNFSTLASSKEAAYWEARQYYGDMNKRWYERGVVVPVQIIQQAEYR